MAIFTPQDGDGSILRFPTVHCPHCGYTMDAVCHHTITKDIQKTPPKTDDITLCLECLQISVFVVSFGLSLRMPTVQEVRDYELDFGDYRRMVEDLKRANPRPPRGAAN